MKTAKELLVEAQEYLSDERHIVKDSSSLFETPEGVDITLRSHKYIRSRLLEGNCRVCLSGALVKLITVIGGPIWEDYSTAAKCLELAVIEDNFNVHRDATVSNHTRMLKIYARAIELAEKKETKE